MSFWQQLEKPFIALAPMADVTDAVFRRLIAKCSAHERRNGTIGGPDVMWTEFVSADGLVRADKEGKKKLLADLIFTEDERPIVAQLFSSVPKHIEEASKLCLALGFDGVDINMGCPDRKIEKQGSGAAMIKSMESAKEVIQAAQAGAKSFDGGIPVSVKTRLGYNEDVLEEWLGALLSMNLAAITLHARTRKEMSKVPARWDRIARAVEIRNEMDSKALILGNGDVASVEEAYERATQTSADGIMIGRGIFGNPWFFHPKKDLSDISIKERLMTVVEHTELFEELLPHKNFAVMKKHYKAYVQGFLGAKEFRMKLMETKTAKEVEETVLAFLAEQN